MQPATILWALILSIPGAFIALFVTGTAISMPSMIGIIMLMGIATKNSILLVEYAIASRRERGMDRMEALLDACSKRARPIVMTTMAMARACCRWRWIWASVTAASARRWRLS